jgi:hypothetical protein
VPDPAYESAQVLAVRAAAPPPPPEASRPTPNLDQLALRRALELEAALDAKYLHRPA